MAKIVLHMGAHKTATSYLQGAFYRNRKLLEHHGLHYPHIGPNNAHHALAAQWIAINDIPQSFYDRRGPAGLWDDLIADYATRPGTLFLSAENFSRVHPERIDMAGLAERLSAFEAVKIVYTMRRQVDLVPSVWAQIAKVNHMPSIWAFMRTVFEERRAKGVPVDHHMVYQSLLAGFAPDQIHLLDYSAFRSHPGGALGVFLDLLDCGLRATDLQPPSEEEANISPDPLALFVAGVVTADGSRPPAPALVSEMAKALDEILGRPRTLLARHEYAKLHDRFREGNQRLVERVQPYQPGFAFAEGTAPEGLAYRDDLDAEAWMKIASAVYHMPRETPPGPWRSWLGGG